MENKKFFEDIKKFWNWIWNSDSFLSWIIALFVIFVFVKLIFFPGLSFITGASLPLAGVESSSMDHQVVKDDFGNFGLCGEDYSSKNINYLNFDKYWNICGKWYEERNITKDDFLSYPLKNGFKKGDIVVVWGRIKPEVGDIIVFKANPESIAPRPIVHRVISISEKNNKKIFSTKGDHNSGQLTMSNNIYRTDETFISSERVIGKVIFKIPYLGWLKIWAVEIYSYFFLNVKLLLMS